MQARPSSRILPLALALLAAGCAEDWRPRGGDGTIAAQRGGGEASIAGWPGAIAGSVAQRRPSAGFARLPDRGNLVAYPTQRIIRRDGAYTWHRADLSEAHALAAIADGSLRLTTPTGETLDFAYERHEEHPSGDWTWVGRLERGAAADEIVLTFGDKAAFGTIAQPGGEPLRLTIRDGAAWLIETDPARVADIRNRATQPEGPDYLVPPSSASSREADTAASGPSTASAPSTAAATSSSAPVIDLVLGYTPGFAAMYGGQSQAVTRLNNMVAITNEAYANSQMTGRVRLVHTLQVSFADNTDNGDTLEKLTGYKSGTGPIATDPAFDALRAARDQYGADLVSIVRKFNDPENSGCGIAWMIGGGGSTIDTGDAPFGYSVVSDGTDSGTDGKTYFCREETLAHEIGHNLGSQHDQATATEDGKVKQGAYSYSFGYKTDSANGNFYTVMAYGDSGQTRYRVFSNPRTTFCGGRACGIADQADNVRSQGQTMSIVAGFRAERINLASREIGAVRARDINLDGRDDLVWENPVSNEHGYWLMGGGSYVGMRFFGATPKYRIIATADFNGDGRMDELWSGEARDLWMLIGNGSGFVDYYVDTHSAGWKIIGTGDVNGDRRADVIWQNFQTNEHGYWLMDGPRHVGMRFFPATPGYRIIATGDFNGDRLLDQLWSGEARDLWMLLGNGSGFKDYYVATHSAGWKIVSAGDVNRDGRDDVIWHNSSTREHGYWLMDGPRHFDMRFFSAIPGGWIAATGDFNGDGWLDELWTNSARDIWMLAGNAGNFSSTLIHTHSENWSITGTRTNW
jgi:hypothetical protein